MTDDNELIRRGDVLERLDLAEHGAQERDWRSGANELHRIRRYVAALPAVSDTATWNAAIRAAAEKFTKDGWAQSDILALLKP